MSFRLLAGVFVALLGVVAFGSTAAQTHRAPVDSFAEAEAVPSGSILEDRFVRVQGKEGLDLLYDMRAEAARERFEAIDDRYPDHPVGPFLEGLNLWWNIMLDLTNTSYDEAFFEKMNEVLARCEALLDEDPDHFDALLFQGVAYGFKARLASNRSSWLKALRNGRKAIKPIREVVEKAPEENGDYVLGKGLYDYYTAILEEEHPAVKAFTWMIPDGDRERGLRLMKQTATEGRYVKTEAIYYLAQVYYLYEEEYPQARRYVRKLRERHPENPYFHNFEGRVYAKWGRWDQAQRVFSEVVERREEGRPGYNVHMEEIARYYLGRERLRAEDYDDALTHLSRLERLTDRDVEDNRYRVLGFLYQGMVYDALNRRDLAERRYRLVLDMDDPSDGYVHDRAERFLNEPYTP